MRAAPVLALSLAFALPLLGCASTFTSAKDDLRRGDAANARVKLVSVEADVAAWNEKDRAEYALERGVTHLSLGDRDAATLWLKKANDMVRADPQVLNEQNRARLKVSLETTSFPRP